MTEGAITGPNEKNEKESITNNILISCSLINSFYRQNVYKICLNNKRIIKKYNKVLTHNKSISRLLYFIQVCLLYLTVFLENVLDSFCRIEKITY